MKRTVQKFSRELFLIVIAVGAQFPMLDAQATTILPAANNGTTVWTGNNLAALDPAQIAAIVGTPGLGLYYDAQFGKAQPPSWPAVQPPHRFGGVARAVGRGDYGIAHTGIGQFLVQVALPDRAG